MEFKLPVLDNQTSNKLDLNRVFGEGATKLVAQVAHDNPALSEEQVIDYAWSLIPEATAYMLPADADVLTEHAINIHEGYEAERRVRK